MIYLTVKEAAEVMNISIQAVYQAIRFDTLKAKKISKQLFTSNEWIDEYRSKLHSKQEHSRYNGRPTFSQDRGELSTRMAANRLGVDDWIVYEMIHSGKIRGYKRGVYWVIPEEQLAIAERIIEDNLKIS